MRICLYLAPWVLLIGCSSCAPRVVAMDAATDARDVASDVRISPQTCSEAGVNPAFSCPLVASPNAGWRRIGCLPRCGIEIADDPTQSEPPALVWEPCADGRVGCTEFRVPESDYGNRTWSFQAILSGSDILVWVLRGPARAYGDHFAHLISMQSRRVIYGSRQLARYGLNCMGLPLATHPLRGVDGFSSYDDSYPLSGRFTIDVATGRVEPSILRVFDFVSCGGRLSPSDCAAYSHGMVCITSARQVFRWNDDQRSPEWLSDYGRLQGVPSEIRSVGEDVWFTTSSWDFDLTVQVVTAGQGVRRLVPAPGGDAHAFGTDGIEMAWLEGIGRDRQNSPADGNIFTTNELYTAPYTTDPARVQRRLVGRLPDLRTVSSGALGDGYYLYPSSNPWPQPFSITVVRLRDGAYWRLHPGEGFEWTPGAPVWIGHGEIALGRSFLVAPQRGELRSLQRIRLDALGTPDGVLPR